MSLDGFVNNREGDTSPLYPDLEKLRETEFLKESIRNTGAVVMGRRSYDMAQGDVTGYEYQVPLFIVTHHPPKEAPKGQNRNLKVHFVTTGVEAAIREAKIAARGKDVQVVGGVDVLRQLLAKGLVDELDVGIVPIFLGGGLRYFDGFDQLNVKLERTRIVESPTRTDLFFRVVK
jgi:dihydrofolate reductase